VFKLEKVKLADMGLLTIFFRFALYNLTRYLPLNNGDSTWTSFLFLDWREVRGLVRHDNLRGRFPLRKWDNWSLPFIFSRESRCWIFYYLIIVIQGEVSAWEMIDITSGIVIGSDCGRGRRARGGKRIVLAWSTAR
jgi:hypothetical protein